MKVNCKHCRTPFVPAANQMRGQQVYCCTDCRIRYYRNVTKLRYRNDPAFREAAKTQALQRYYRRTA